MEYSYNDKLYLFNNLNKVSDKNHIRDIIKIISFKNQKNILEQENGIYIKFNNLTNDTYHELEQYLNNMHYDTEKEKHFMEYNQF